MDEIFQNDDGMVDLHNEGIACLTVIGQIEGHYVLPEDNKTTKYEHIIPTIFRLENSESVKGLLLILNTVGGDIEAGLAIAELIAGMSKPTVSLVLGGCHSIGIPMAVAAKKTFIAPSSTMTVHPVRMNGMILGVSQTFEYFRNIQERIIQFVSSNSRISCDRFRALMLDSGNLINDIGTLLNGTRAVEEGIIDQVGTLSEAIKELKNMRKFPK